MVRKAQENEHQKMTFFERLDWMCKYIMLMGAPRPWIFYGWHVTMWLVNYSCFALVVALVPRPIGMARGSYCHLLFVKLLVWQHMAEAVGCRQGPLSGHFALPNNWKYRLSLGTLKCTPLRLFGDRRTILDLFVHSLFFIACAGFLASPQYAFLCLRTVCVCDIWILCSDMQQFFASAGHAYWTLLFAGCFPPEMGQLAGMQIALLLQWFFAGVGKVGPWFNYVTGPFMLQSRWLGGQHWLFKLLVKSQDDLSPTRLGVIVAQSCALFECMAPLALAIPHHGCIWIGLVGLVAMHVYILALPAPFDVYSWNTCYALSGIYLFYGSGVFGVDLSSLVGLSPWLVGVLACEFAVCWCGQFFPNHVGSYLSHRHWAGNWVQTIFLVKNTETVKAKLEHVRAFAGHPISPCADDGPNKHNLQSGKDMMLYFGLAYLWLGSLNMKCFPRLVQEALELVGSCAIDDYKFMSLHSFCAGEFRDGLYMGQLLPAMQRRIGFETGECLMLQFGAFRMFGDSATWKIYDMNKGLLAAGDATQDGLTQMHSLPSQSLDLSLPLTPNSGSGGKLSAPLLVV